jgi:hypothetical protein
MFEKVVLHRSAEGPAISIGDIAEALLFHQNLPLVLDYSSFSSLIDKVCSSGSGVKTTVYVFTFWRGASGARAQGARESAWPLRLGKDPP